MPEAFPYADHTYRRRIDVRPTPDAVEAEMEDYCHHFRVRIEHRDGLVERADSWGVRIPWETCVTGAEGVRTLAGTSLVAAIDPARWAPDRSTHCVHVLDLTLIAVRHALDAAPTSYEAIVRPGSHRRRQATLDRDGRRVLSWSLDGEMITEPERFSGVSLARASFFTWIRDQLPEGDHEPAVVLRRACYIGMSRGLELDAYAYAADLHAPDNSCYTYRTDVAVGARRVTGSSRATEADRPLA